MQSKNLPVVLFAIRLTKRPANVIAPQMVRAGLTLSQALAALRLAARSAK